MYVTDDGGCGFVPHRLPSMVAFVNDRDIFIVSFYANLPSSFLCWSRASMQVRHRPALTLRRKGEAKKQKEMGHRRVTFIKGAGYVRPQYVALKCYG